VVLVVNDLHDRTCPITVRWTTRPPRIISACLHA
jgi:hypothetical protein